jgi:radical SAM protein with 4Fe4S-binding SPASM domain
LNEFKSQSITVNFDGSFGPCDVTAEHPAYSLGNICTANGDLKERFSSPRNFRIFKNLDTIDVCKSCAFKYSCAGGCEEESLRPGYDRTIYCDYYYQTFAAVACNLKSLAAMGYASKYLAAPLQTATHFPQSTIDATTA